MSKFAILKQVEPADDGTGTTYEHVATTEAKTSGQALRAYCTENNVTTGTFAVVSTRNFAPKTISVEQRAVLKVG